MPLPATERSGLMSSPETWRNLSMIERLAYCNDRFAIPDDNRAVVSKKTTDFKNRSGALYPSPVRYVSKMTSAHLLLDYCPGYKLEKQMN